MVSLISHLRFCTQNAFSLLTTCSWEILCCRPWKRKTEAISVHFPPLCVWKWVCGILSIQLNKRLFLFGSPWSWISSLCPMFFFLDAIQGTNWDNKVSSAVQRSCCSPGWGLKPLSYLVFKKKPLTHWSQPLLPLVPGRRVTRLQSSLCFPLCTFVPGLFQTEMLQFPVHWW